MHSDTGDKKPRITIMGEEVAYEDVPGTGATSLDDYFKPVRILPRAIDQASRIVPIENWQQTGLYTWLRMRAEHVFAKLPTDKTEARLGVMKYVFDFDENGPVLKSVSV